MKTVKEIFRLLKIFFTTKRPLSGFDFIPEDKTEKSEKKGSKRHFLV